MVVPVFAIAATVVATAMGQVVYKLFFVRRQIRFLAFTGITFLVAQGCCYVALRDLEIGVVYMSTALTHLVIIWASHHVFREKITRDHVLALSLIVCGVVVYAW